MLTMYSTTWCGYCYRLKSQFDREGIAYNVIDIEQDLAALCRALTTPLLAAAA